MNMTELLHLWSEAVEIIADLVGDDDCQYDHHDYCQTHYLHGRPCPHERGRDLLHRTSPEGSA